MQNQTPEIQAKLLAMQRAMVTKATTPTTVTVSQSFEDMDEDSLSSLKLGVRTPFIVRFIPYNIM